MLDYNQMSPKTPLNDPPEADIIGDCLGTLNNFGEITNSIKHKTLGFILLSILEESPKEH